MAPPSLTISQTTNRITKERFNNTDYNYTYDNAGKLKYDRVCSDYKYDAENRLVTATCAGATATYAYDGAGRRVKKTAAGSTTLYFFSGSTAIAEKTGTQWKDYLYSGSALLASIENGTATYWHQDHLSNRVASSSSGIEIGEQGHLPFGEYWYGPGGGITKWMFTTYERDPETSLANLDYARFRQYGSRLGRFMQVDPLSGSLSNPQSLNRNAYVLNDPCNRVDPFGLVPECTLTLNLVQGSGVTIPQMQQLEKELGRIFTAAGVGIQLTTGTADFTFNVVHNRDLPSGFPATGLGWDPGWGPVGWGALDRLGFTSEWDTNHTGLAIARVTAHEMGHFLLQAGHTNVDPSEGPGNIMERGDASRGLLTGTADWVKAFWTFFDPGKIKTACQNLREKRPQPQGGGGGGATQTGPASLLIAPWFSGYNFFDWVADQVLNNWDFGPGSGWNPSAPPPKRKKRGAST